MLNLSFLKENSREMFRVTAILFFYLICGSSVAGERDFAFAAIPAPLLENANTVIRYRETTLDISAADKATMKVSFALTVVKDNAIDKAILIVPYNNFTTIRHVKGTVYDRDGKKVERVEQDHFLDVSAISGFSTYEDNRVIACKPKYQTVPFTIEYTYEIDFNGIFDYPDFFLVDDFNSSLEQAELHISVPDFIGIRYFQRNTNTICKAAKEKSVETYSWSFGNVPSIREEPFSPPIREIAPVVMLAPGSFKIRNKSGNTDDWQSFGLWFHELIRERDDLGEATRQKMVDLTAGVSDTLEKIRKIYHYLQEKTRYVSIQIGLGGWQPTPASEVDKLGYGDCKALTNYMKALLSAAGIPSCYTLVAAGNDMPDLVREFPANQFNHAILCVPLMNDTIWLECTSQSIPAGYLGAFTDDRQALLIKETGGFLCRTPLYDERENFQNRSIQAQLFENGTAVMEVKTSYYGVFYDLERQILDQDHTDKRKNLVENIPAPDFTLEKFTLKENKSGNPSVEETLNLTINKTLAPAGNLMLFKPNQLTREKEFSSQVINRKNPVAIRRSVAKSDTVYYALPAELSFTGNHIDQTVTSRFGDYRATSTLQGNTLRYVRHLQIWKGAYSKESYEELLDFLEKVAHADSKKITLKPAYH
ncbi:MAG TPA: DUF3857 and transglutaminase domain-containing protein [Bacteroidales bacterium]|nr:DUF3857 and transglutaminase domain-containing protein [Bacteroidales bacterium]